ncbi:MAG: patatin-like phospholipase family protein [Spirochaetes bacterium]|nr:patatin-like phospholipase family protein [Spirochaetota bacterium]
MFNKKKYALVLGGGGAKGAYQIGAWKAFKKLGIRFNAIMGTSIGALNGALILQDDLELGIDLWENMSLEKIVSIPSEIIKDGELYINKKNVSFIREFQKKIFKNMGLDTNPLQQLLKKYINEQKIRKSKIDFGIVTYQLSSMKPVEIFLDDIQEGLLLDYLLASASLPGFKTTMIKGKQFTDGGVYDNVPFAMAKQRGYRNIIVVDISGLGLNRRPDIVRTETIYIKNSIDIGNIFDFKPKLIKDFMNLGYIETLKVFGKIDGIEYFYNIDKKIIDIMEHLLFKKEIFDKYKKYFEAKEIIYSEENIKKNIREILPKGMKNYISIIIALAESAAISLNIEKNRLYNFREFLEAIWNKYNEIKKEESLFSEKNFKTFFEKLPLKIKNTNLVKNFIKHFPYEYEKALELIAGKNKTHPHIKAIANFFPNLLSARIFIILLESYFA